MFFFVLFMIFSDSTHFVPIPRIWCKFWKFCLMKYNQFYYIKVQFFKTGRGSWAVLGTISNSGRENALGHRFESQLGHERLYISKKPTHTTLHTHLWLIPCHGLLQKVQIMGGAEPLNEKGSPPQAQKWSSRWRKDWSPKKVQFLLFNTKP